MSVLITIEEVRNSDVVQLYSGDFPSDCSYFMSFTRSKLLEGLGFIQVFQGSEMGGEIAVSRHYIPFGVMAVIEPMEQRP